MAANAVGSATGTGLVTLVLAGLGVATGIVKTDGGVQRLALGLVGVFVVLIGLAVTIALIRVGIRSPVGQRGDRYAAAVFAVLITAVMSSIFLTASVYFDPHLCEKQPAACQGGEF